MNAIAVGYTGKLAMLKAVYGSAEEDEPDEAPVLTQEAFGKMFGGAR